MHIHIGWPQFIVCMLHLIYFVENVIKHGKEAKSKYNAWTAVFGIVITMLLLAWGGFFS